LETGSEATGLRVLGNAAEFWGMLRNAGGSRAVTQQPKSFLALFKGLMASSDTYSNMGSMGISNDPTCNYCEEGLETKAHYLCECSHFVTLRQEIWGKSYLHPAEADSVQNLVRFILKSHRFS